MIISSIASDKFLTFNNLLTVLKQNSITGVLSVGVSIAILSGGIDASSAFMMVSGVMLAGKISFLPLEIIIPTILLFTFIMGTITGITVAYLNVVPFIATMGMATIMEGFSLLISDGKPITWTTHLDFIKTMGTGKVLGIPNLVITFIVIIIVGQLVLSRTKLGFSWRAIGGNSTAAYWSGVKSKAYTMLAYSFSAMMAGIAAVFLISRVGASDPAAGNTLTMDAIAAAVLGGTYIGGQGVGSIWGALLGTFILGMINNIFNLVGFSSYAQLITKGVIVILAVVVGSRSVKKK
ncbi:MAG: ABC transporter permease [Christensenellales bacterium]